MVTVMKRKRRFTLMRLRAIWHILRDDTMIYNATINEGCWQTGREGLVLVNCRMQPEFILNGVPAVEQRQNNGDVVVKACAHGH